MTRRVAFAAGLATLAIVLCALPFATSNYLVRLATIAFMYVTLASSWNIIGGLTGYPSFATAAFFGLGAYGSGIVRVYASLPAAWLAGAAAAGLFALLIGPAILRLRGHYFAVASLVLAAVLREIVNGATSVTGGGMGLNLPGSTLLGVDATARLYYCSMLAAAAGTVALTVVIVRSRVGWALRCIEQNEDAAMVLGINTLNAKVGLGRVRRDDGSGRRDLRDLDRLHRSERRLRRHPVDQTDRHGVPRRRWDGVRTCLRRRHLRRARRARLAKRPELPCRDTRHDHRVSAGVRPGRPRQLPACHGSPARVGPS
jgi:hypothetical protein